MGSAVDNPSAYIEHLPVGSYVRVTDLPGSREAARTAAHRAAKRSELVHVRQGLYYKGKQTRYGMTRPPAEEVALEILGRRGVGPAGVSAARAFNLTTQVPVVPELASAGPVPTGLTGVCVRKRNNMARRELGYTEVALLELLRDWRHSTEADWSDIVKAVEAKVRSGAVDPAKVLAAARGERSRAVYEVVTSLLEPLVAP